ncbi:hypothetical protein GGF46_003735 [Coemansia sp. RSA 552]|nr:hypothetical protein GGF46_003735 [Coemansia sp. RSA 552]
MSRLAGTDSMENQGLLAEHSGMAGRRRWQSTGATACLAAVCWVFFDAAAGSAGFIRRGECAGDAHGLASDCLRLGIAWPATGVALTALVLANLVRSTWSFVSDSSTSEVERRENNKHLRFHDNRFYVAAASGTVALAGAVLSLWFLADRQQGQAYERVYWAVCLAFWAAAALAFGLHAAALAGRRRAGGSSGAFHWTLMAGVFGQVLVGGLAEGYFSFFSADHAADQAWLTTAHSRFVLGSLCISTAAVLLPLSAYRRGFYLPRGPQQKDAPGTVAPGVDAYEYETPLSRTRKGQTPLVESPEYSDSVIGRLVFSWVTPVLQMGTRVTIDSADLYHLGACDRPLAIWRRYVACRGTRKSLLKTLGLTFAPQLVAQALLAALNALLAFASPFFLQRILREIRLYSGGNNPETASKRVIFFDAVGLLLASLLHSLSSNQVLWIGRKVSLRLQGLLVAELSSKALRRRGKSAAPPSPKANSSNSDATDDEDEDRTAASDGRVANMLTSDLQSIGHISSYLDNIYTLPIVFCLGSWYLYNLLGVAALIGLLLTAVFIPLTRLMVRYLLKYQKQLMALDDERVTMITEVFQGIRAVKLFGWQSRFVDKVRAKRDEEISVWWRLMLLQLPVNFVRSLTTSTILVTILGLYTLVFGHTLTADIVFPSVTVFSMVSGTFNSIPGLFRWFSGCYVSLKRIETFMVQSQLQPIEQRVDLAQEEPEGSVGFVGASFVWDSELPDDASPSGSSATNAKLADSDSSSDQMQDQTNVPSRASSASMLSEAAEENEPLLSSTRNTTYHAITPGSRASSIDIDDSTPTTAVSADGTAPEAPHPKGMVSFALKDITLRFPAGGLSVIAGSTGSGKSSLLSALIGEMSLTSGRVILPTADPRDLDSRLGVEKYREIIELSSQGDLIMTDVAYVSQEAWLRNATVRENILFGELYEEKRYEEVLRVCALKPDLRILTAGDQTEIGERGITLSGGQKQRVALARAVYSSRRVLLIDDCLSAVDAHTGKHILNECLLGQTPLMRGRTRVLVTHHVSACLPHSDFVAVLKAGRVVLSGTPQELQTLGHFSSEVLSLDRQKEEPEEDTGAEEGDAAKGNSRAPNVNDMKPEDAYNQERRIELARQQGLPPDAPLPEEGQLVEDEEREQGYVQPEVWLEYMRMCGNKWYWVLVMSFVVVNRFAGIAQDYWVRLWMSDSTGAHSAHGVVFWLGSYILIEMINTMFRLAMSIIETMGAMRSARLYHEQLFGRVMNAAPRFFDKTPIGRVISRFSRDMRTIDDAIISTISILVMQLVQVGSVFAIISMVTPPFTIIAILMLVMYTMLAIYYLNATRELKRLDSISMSPLLSLFSELITGVESIRAFGVQNQYTLEAMNRVDTHNRPYYLMWAANRWLCARIEFSGCIVSFSTTVLIILSLDRIDAGLAGFVLMYAITFSDCMLWFIRNYSECEISMNAVERINQYLRVDQEAPAFVPEDQRPPYAWPRSGDVKVRDLTVEYIKDTPVLHAISFNVNHGEKIGIVGRTGSGKSTLSLAFLRFIEAVGGNIVVDGVDIARVGLEDLRRNFTIIPQDPVLFNGTIRFNLDPFSEYPDALLWDALERSHLSHTAQKDTDDVAEMDGVFSSLDAEIKESGQNLSLGQRQLVALARALVRRSRLIIMDEATASVDFDTDERIQRTIRGPEFADSTLFCIAHRLRTIIDYDRVLVLDKGRVVEFDTPWNLLQNADGHFKTMCEKTGEFNYLFGMAQNNKQSE